MSRQRRPPSVDVVDWFRRKVLLATGEVPLVTLTVTIVGRLRNRSLVDMRVRLTDEVILGGLLILSSSAAKPSTRFVEAPKGALFITDAVTGFKIDVLAVKEGSRVSGGDPACCLNAVSALCVS